MHSFSILVGSGSRSHDLFGAAMTSFVTWSSLSNVNDEKEKSAGGMVNVGGDAISVDDWLCCSFFVKNADTSVALRDDLSFTYDDDLPEIILIDCQKTLIGCRVDFVFPECAPFSISRSMLRFQRCCSCCTVGCIEFFCTGVWACQLTVW